jgi:ABC-type polysaccharide/polyol phosphate transport system ATPase subunit
MAAALTFENVSKTFRFTPDDSMRDTLASLGARLVGREQRQRRRIEALKDVSFEVLEGQSFALVGLNGAGKTTAMKIATRVLYPSAGSVRVRGRVGALIEVGTGLHPDLTGLENIDLYGRILGLSRQAIAVHKEAIMDFADIGESIEQPVKQFSSGMQLRLGFAIAAHLDPEVLVVDEAIAVGDVGFKYKCMERMAKLVKEGRTLIFVSHDMAAVETLCQRAVLLNRGRVELEGTATEVVRTYLDRIQREIADAELAGAQGYRLDVTRVSFHDARGREITDPVSGAPLTVRLHYRAHERLPRPHFSIGFTEGNAQPLVIASMLSDGSAPEAIEGEGWVECQLDSLPLTARPFEIWGSVRDESGYADLLHWTRLRRFEVVSKKAPSAAGKAAVSLSSQAPILMPFQWRTQSAAARSGER